MTVASIMFALIRAEFAGESLPANVREALTPETLVALYEMAHSQDLAHIVEQALRNANVALSEETAQKLKKDARLAAYRYAQSAHVYGQLCSVLEREKIPYLPLKGVVLRQHYPQPWMRTSSDIDVLVHEEDLERAKNALIAELDCRNEGRGFHDISLFTPNNVHLELHFTLLEASRFPQAQKILEKVWQYTVPAAGSEFCRLMTEEMFYFYHILHMAHHLKCGGCGIRPFLDIWMLNRGGAFDEKKRYALLREGGLDKLARASEKLTAVWFAGAEMDAQTEQFGAYIFRGGLYGNSKNRDVMGQAATGSKLRYIITHRIFIPYNFLRIQYPALNKHKWLLPWYQLMRWIDALRRGKWKKGVKELQTNSEISAEEKENAASLTAYLGLD